MLTPLYKSIANIHLVCPTFRGSSQWHSGNNGQPKHKITLSKPIYCTYTSLALLHWTLWTLIQVGRSGIHTSMTP